ncbi:DivIVA domain-containing protein [Nocardia paucivorans]|uniref:DivIVA domain-containing protein n=1 Tax=Nocardia paucivorans TaxID=114259 RepID=UPI0002E97503|nr:DivIVA domain-containing protein [Nocardia paucivorans]
MTPEDVHRTTFATALPWQRGYRIADVDDFLDHIAAALTGRAALTVADLDRVAFGEARWWTRGYRAEQVDAFIQRVRAEFGSRA